LLTSTRMQQRPCMAVAACWHLTALSCLDGQQRLTERTVARQFLRVRVLCDG
jgi:hypothetical protein